MATNEDDYQGMLNAPSRLRDLNQHESYTDMAEAIDGYNEQDRRGLLKELTILTFWILRNRRGRK